VADEKESEKKKGPKGGAKHNPGRGHTRKSTPGKRKRFRKKAAKKRRTRRAELRKQWDEWDSLPPEVQRMRPDKKPKLPRPDDES
jgi:hypothetical protein